MPVNPGKVVAISLSGAKGMKKSPVASCRLISNFGIEGDAHAGDHPRQVSLLSHESILNMKKGGLDVGPGSFAENIVTNGIDLSTLKSGDEIYLGRDVVIEVTQIGKECHKRCSIYEQAGDCIMPREGVFAKVVIGGDLNVGDEIKIQPI